jgi:hypothetical protein
MENCDICNMEFEYDLENAFEYKLSGNCLCLECLEKKDIKQEIEDDCRGLSEN